MHGKMFVATGLAMIAALALPAAAQQAGASLQACRAEPDDARRLACFDREIDRLGQQQGAGTTAASAAADAAPALTPEDQFGRTGALNREEYDRRTQETRDLEELHATVTEIWKRADGLMILTLDNGQVWKQNRPDSQFRVKAGEPVKIQPAALGSFLLSGPSKRSTRVTRVK